MSLEKYDPSNSYKIKTRKAVLKNAEDLLKTRNKIIRHSKMVFFHQLKICKKKKRDQRSKSWLVA